MDPASQSKALLGKLTVRGLLPERESWKELLLYRIQKRVPIAGRPWQHDTRWLFSRAGLTRRIED